VPVRYEVEAIIFRIILELDPVLEGAEIVAYVQAACGAHAADYAFFLDLVPSRQTFPLLYKGARHGRRPLQRHDRATATGLMTGHYSPRSRAMIMRWTSLVPS